MAGIGRRGNPNLAGHSNVAVPPKHLADMRAVYERDDPSQDTPSQRPLRNLKLDDFEKFLKLLHQYERDWSEDQRRGRADRRAAAKAARETREANALLKLKVEGKPAEGEKEKMDEGTEAALSLIEKILKEAK